MLALAARRATQPFRPLALGATRSFASKDPRGHLYEDGTRAHTGAMEPGFHQPTWGANIPKMQTVKERGQKWVKPHGKLSLEECYGVQQADIPFHPRSRLNIWGNYRLILKAEFLFFYIPTVIVAGIVIPCFLTIYTLEECVYTTMTVKVVGRQWYWVYEVESPTDDCDEE
uniref:Mitochondrial cytochrome c oxidase subunit 2a n=1 Tax=Oxyrrhis marina TaxID=2969 RepID=A0ESB6_OXYMA|nr:mitochondrial cytochrome c oxidase subunit 2a [Oxyrrhis marina]